MFGETVNIVFKFSAKLKVRLQLNLFCQQYNLANISFWGCCSICPCMLPYPLIFVPFLQFRLKICELTTWSLNQNSLLKIFDVIRISLSLEFVSCLRFMIGSMSFSHYQIILAKEELTKV